MENRVGPDLKSQISSAFASTVAKAMVDKNALRTATSDKNLKSQTKFPESVSGKLEVRFFHGILISGLND